MHLAVLGVSQKGKLLESCGQKCVFNDQNDKLCSALLILFVAIRLHRPWIWGSAIDQALTPCRRSVSRSLTLMARSIGKKGFCMNEVFESIDPSAMSITLRSA